jgi:hydroxymethylpyrimidine/phosphomethylpyrimidine kinase
VAVTGLELVSPDLVAKQLSAVFEDIGVDAVKIGLLGGQANTMAVAGFLSKLEKRPPVILDPVMVSASGHAFLSDDAVEALKALMPLSTLVTPNLPEAAALSKMELSNPDKDRMLKAAEKILAFGSERVLIKGGHGQGLDCVDLLFGGDEPVWLSAPRVKTPNTHGTGCTLSSAIAAAMARGEKLEEAARLAKHYVIGGLVNSIDLGAGPGPLNHFHHFYNFKGGRQNANA